jgi:hypothetical protein
MKYTTALVAIIGLASAASIPRAVVDNNSNNKLSTRTVLDDLNNSLPDGTPQKDQQVDNDGNQASSSSPQQKRDPRGGGRFVSGRFLKDVAGDIAKDGAVAAATAGGDEDDATTAAAASEKQLTGEGTAAAVVRKRTPKKGSGSAKDVASDTLSDSALAAAQAVVAAGGGDGEDLTKVEPDAEEATGGGGGGGGGGEESTKVESDAEKASGDGGKSTNVEPDAAEASGGKESTNVDPDAVEKRGFKSGKAGGLSPGVGRVRIPEESLRQDFVVKRVPKKGGGFGSIGRAFRGVGKAVSESAEALNNAENSKTEKRSAAFVKPTPPTRRSQAMVDAKMSGASEAISRNGMLCYAAAGMAVAMTIGTFNIAL